MKKIVSFEVQSLNEPENGNQTWSYLTWLDFAV